MPNFIGRQAMVHSQLVSHTLAKFSATLKSRKNITGGRHFKMNFVHFLRSMRLNTTSVTFGISISRMCVKRRRRSRVTAQGNALGDESPRIISNTEGVREWSSRLSGICEPLQGSVV